MITPEQIMRIAEEQWQWMSFFDSHDYLPLETPDDLLREAHMELGGYEYEGYRPDDWFSEEHYKVSLYSLQFIVDVLTRLGVVGRKNQYDEGFCIVCGHWVKTEKEYGPWYCEEHNGNR